MNWIERSLAEVDRFTPKDGSFHLVGVDDFAVPGEDALYLIGRFSTRAEAEAAKAAEEKTCCKDEMHIYAAP